MKDKESRKILMAYLQNLIKELRIYQEKNIGNSVCDIMVVSNILAGYEIKSDRDNYQRLKEQEKNYDRFFDRNYLVVGHSHAETAANHMTYTSIIHKSKKRDRKTLENFKKYFLPQRYLESFLKFADTMTDRTIKNMLHSVCSNDFTPVVGQHCTRILYLHGTKGNEVYSKKSAQKMKKYYPDMEIKCFDGYKHAELAVYEPDKWLDTVIPFLK